MIAATAAGPTVFWYATRGSGYTALILLTAAVVIGIVTSVRWSSPAWPRFMSQSVHRNLSLLVVVFLAIHIATSIIDPFARLNIRDAVVPVGAGYRPVWLGLGVVAAELFVAVLVTSLVRRHMPYLLWRVVHLLAYASWPVALLHTLGTGSDTRSVWAIALVVLCVGSVVGAGAWRLASGWPRRALLRTAGFSAGAAGLVAVAVWTASGPMRAGWAVAAGTPLNLLAGTAAPPTPRPVVLAAGLNDPLQGSLARTSSRDTATLQDTRTPSLRVIVSVSADGSATLTVLSNGQTVCVSQAQVFRDITATCGSVEAVVQGIAVDRDTVTARLVTK